MKRFPALFLAILLVLDGLLLAACGPGRAVGDMLAAGGLQAGKLSGWTAEVRYLSESKGSNYLYARLDGAALDELVRAVLASEPAKAPRAGQFSPQMQSDCELVFRSQSGKAVSLYYSTAENLLTYVDRQQVKGAERLSYLFYAPQEGFADLVERRKESAKLKESDEVQPFRNMEELKSSIDPDELAEEGEELEFEFYDGALPENAGTACRIYTHGDVAAVPADSYLITTYGKDKTGKQVRLSITGIDANSNYTKVFVMEPDDALDSVDTGEDAPVSNAVTVKTDAIDPGKWIVFVDEDNTIFDVILPEDIGRPAGTAVSTAPSVSATASASATASTSATASVTASASASPGATAFATASASASPAASPTPTEDVGDAD